MREGERERERKKTAAKRSTVFRVPLVVRNSSLVVYRLIKRARSNTERATDQHGERRGRGQRDKQPVYELCALELKERKKDSKKEIETRERRETNRQIGRQYKKERSRGKEREREREKERDRERKTGKERITILRVP